MRGVIFLAAGLAVTGGMAAAGGIERSTQSVGVLFEPGNYLEFGLSGSAPDVSGTQLVPLTTPPGSSSDDMATDYGNWSVALKAALGSRWDFALILDQPVGAGLRYPAGTGYTYGGSTANIDSNALTGLLRYRLDGRWSLIGGIRIEEAKGSVALFNGYKMHTSTETDLGYIVGVAWERPDRAQRVALTYQSAIDHDFTADENIAASPTEFTTTVPQSVNLEFQTGVTADTLLFGSVRWRDWSDFDIAPEAFINDPSNPDHDPLVRYNGDTWTYVLGVGHRFTPSWSGSVSLTWEPPIGGLSGNLGPTDGKTAIALAGTWTRGPMKVTTGIQYSWLGDTETRAPFPYPDGTALSDFEENEALSAGIRIGYRF